MRSASAKFFAFLASPRARTCIDGCVALTGDGITAGGLRGRLGRSGFCPLCRRLLQQRKAQHTIKVFQNRQLGCVAGLSLQHIIEQSDAHRRVQIIAHLGEEFFPVLLTHRLVHCAAILLQGGNSGNQFLVRPLGIVQIFPGKHQGLAIMALQAEETIAQGIIALFL